MIRQAKTPFWGIIGLCALIGGCSSTKALKSPHLAGFDDAVHHWRNRHGTDYARYDEGNVTAIADNMLLLQRDHGGWVENRDPARILNAEEKSQAITEKSNPTLSFDNRNIYTQVAYLMSAYELTHNDAYRAAALRGLGLIVKTQITTCGGWPHTLPPVTTYHAKITIADEVTSGNLRLLRQIHERKAPFRAIDPITRQKVTKALEAGDACLLRLQVRQGGKPTGWAGQYDPVTLSPSQGRAFELPSIVSQETVEVLRYLMSIEHPSPDVINAVEHGISWLSLVEIKGQRLETFALAEPVKYDYHTAKIDRRLVADPSVFGLWARFYDLEDNSIVLANRDSQRVKSFDLVHPERRSGYGWYGEWPAQLLTQEYPIWRKKHIAKMP